jgi:hypothetical protein
MYQGRTLKILNKAANTLAAPIAMAMLAVCNIASASGGASLSINFPSGFAGSTQGYNTGNPNPNFVSISGTSQGSAIALTSATTAHTAGGASYYTEQNIANGFQTTFTFQLQNVGVPAPTIAGITFNVQNATKATNSNWFNNYGPDSGAGISADANVDGYGCYDPTYVGTTSSQQYIGNSVAIKFDLSNANGMYDFKAGGLPNTTGLYLNGGDFDTLNPANDLTPYGINLYSNHIFKVNIVYDGALLTMTILDTATNAQARQSWPVNIPAATGSSTDWVGFSGGNAAEASGQFSTPGLAGFDILTWSFSTGYNTRLATPTFSVTPGPYSTAQSVTLSAPSGASIYYTTNGLQPTSSSTLYTAGTPITVSSNEVIQAVAIQSGYTDSYVAVGNYQIQAATAPLINFPSGFANNNGLIQLVGHADLNGSKIQLTDTNGNLESGAAWYAAPVNIQNFTSNFTLQLTSASANGMAFVIQNQPPASASGSINISTGGPNAIAGEADALGYANDQASVGDSAGGTAAHYEGLLNSLAVIFDLYNGSGNLVGLYTGGAYPTGSSIDMSSSGVTLHNGNPLAVSLTYNGTTLTLSVTDTVTSRNFTHSWTANIPSLVGASTAYVGFTGATGGLNANQDILSWAYTASATAGPPPPAAPTPAAPTNLRVQ